VPIDAEWNPLMNSIVWSDRRAIEQTELLRAAIGGKRFHEISGLHLSEIWSCAKLRWLVDHRPEIVDTTWKFINGLEWVMHQLGAEEVFTEPSSATMNGMLDLRTRSWSDEIVRATGISPSQLPPLRDAPSPLGKVSARAAELTGFAPGTPLFVGGGDQQCACVGAGVTAPGSLEITIGTGAVAVTVAREYRGNPRDTLVWGAHVIPGLWDIEGIALSSGNCLRWWRDSFCDSDAQGEPRLERTSYGDMDRAASEVPPGSRGLLFLPFLCGQFVPHYDGSASGAFIGLGRSHSHAEAIRAILEGTAFEMRLIVEAIGQHTGHSFPTIRLTGGGARSDLWARILAGILNRNVERLAIGECTALGAALVGAVGARFFSSIEEAVGTAVRVADQIEPDPAVHDRYDIHFAVFRAAYDALAGGVFPALQRLLAQPWLS
jgi:xylulokinase